MGLLNGAWAAYIAIGPLNATYHCPLNGCPASMFAYAQALAIAGGILVVSSLVSFKGFGWALLIDAALSLAVLGLVAVNWSTYGSNSLPSAVLAVVAAAMEIVGSRPAKVLAEKDSPLNLPVFG